MKINITLTIEAKKRKGTKRAGAEGQLIFALQKVLSNTSSSVREDDELS